MLVHGKAVLFSALFGTPNSKIELCQMNKGNNEVVIYTKGEKTQD